MEYAVFYLLDQPTEEEFQNLARRYKEMAPSSVKATVKLLKTGSDVLTGFEKMLNNYGLSQGRFLILIVMNRQPDKLTTPSILAEKIGVTRATMSGLIEGLAKNGFIKRLSHGSDRRKQKLKLTNKGVTLLENILSDYWSRIYNLMRGLTENEERQLVQLLSKISDNISELTKD
jgi:DNA-binding MarR family transcriptional regulator